VASPEEDNLLHIVLYYFSTSETWIDKGIIAFGERGLITGVELKM
jgi:hypothetical protein